ncbi:SDR family NAD(P)-dependent oxidoreductase [Flavobacterium sp. 3HN19-14]|uniref:SDR family NAD(P)-dependent oxidoreductase n=1 Tax=Flavobacterium sp. 3HN19-14 TaxID=3448133 RepID=UPI003EDFC538
MDNFINFSGKTFLVTGGTSGIGLEICRHIAGFGGNLIVTGRNEEKLKALENELGKQINFTSIIFDLEDLTNIDDVVKQIENPVDGVIHSAGMVQLQPVKFLNAGLMEKIRTVNYDAIVLMLSKLLKQKKINNSASIIFITSIAAAIGMKGNLHYSSAKSALSAAARVFASELAVQQIRVNCIAPGQVRTPMTDEIGAALGDETMAIDEKKYPLGYGKPEDVANLAVFLLSDKSRWITGTTIVIDGGRSHIMN